MEHRLTLLRAEVDKLLFECSRSEIRHFFHHLYGVSKFCALLAIKRGVDAELAAAAGLLHDIYQITHKSAENHAEFGAPVAEKMLRAVGGYTDEEIAIITTAIARHSNKNVVHEPLDEVLKDADVLDHNLNSNDIFNTNRQTERYVKTLIELGCKAGINI
ncbi:MAG: HD domain-containing protein [Defluviitaleaceae bacterium]|nr:HD domain-containing protein [Defluviitaleaceae bacterium]